MPLLELRHVAKSYPLAAGRQQVLRDLSLRVETGAALAIVGPSGCGKSTLLNLMGGLDVPDAGQVLLEGRDLATLRERDLAELRHRRLGFVFQLHHLLPQCSVLENVLLPTLVHGSSPAAEARARALLERVGLTEHAAKLPGQLSGGECQRVAVVRALINAPALLLADEPTGALDRHQARDLVQLLLDFSRSEGAALVMVTHAPELAALLGSTLALNPAG